MQSTSLQDGTEVFCLRSFEAKVLDSHVKGYFKHGIALRDGDTVFDVGANIGVFGVRACQQFPNVRVYAFEPVPAIFEVCEANANKFGKGRFRAFRAGVGQEPGKLSFRYYPNAPALSTAHPEMWDNNPGALEKATLSQIRSLPDELWFARYLPAFMAKWFAKRMQAQSVQVEAPIVTLADVLRQEGVQRIDLLKVDCEGAELDVLKGVAPEQWPAVRQVVAEVFDHDGRLEKVVALLRDHAGFPQVVAEEEDAMRDSRIYNVYATR
jgi:FkbM family methyltransferase